MVCNENVNANINSNNIIFTIRCTKLFVAVVNLSAKDRYILKSNFATDCLFWFIQTEITMLKNIIYQRYY